VKQQVNVSADSESTVSAAPQVISDTVPRKSRSKVIIPSPKAKKITRDTSVKTVIETSSTKDQEVSTIINKENIKDNNTDIVKENIIKDNKIDTQKSKRVKKVKEVGPRFTTDITEVHQDIFDELKEYGYKSSIMFTDGINSYVYATNSSGYSNIIIWKNIIISRDYDNCSIQKLDPTLEPSKLLEYHINAFTGYCTNTEGIAFKENNLFRILIKDKDMLPNPKYTCFISQNVEKYPFAIPIISIGQIRENPSETLRYTNENIERLLQQRLQGAINSIGEMNLNITIINNYFNAFESGRKKHMAGIQTAIMQLKTMNNGFLKRPPTSRRGEKEAQETYNSLVLYNTKSSQIVGLMEKIFQVKSELANSANYIKTLHEDLKELSRA
jgi:hypothetical protein